MFRKCSYKEEDRIVDNSMVDNSRKTQGRQMVPYQLTISAAGVNNRTHPTSGNTLAFSNNDNRDQHISILIVLHLHIINTHNTHNNYKYT